MRYSTVFFLDRYKILPNTLKYRESANMYEIYSLNLIVLKIFEWEYTSGHSLSSMLIQGQLHMFVPYPGHAIIWIIWMGHCKWNKFPAQQCIDMYFHTIAHVTLNKYNWLKLNYFSVYKNSFAMYDFIKPFNLYLVYCVCNWVENRFNNKGVSNVNFLFSVILIIFNFNLNLFLFLVVSGLGYE
jgi:hypothetical protein